MGFTSDKKKELMEIDKLFESINDFSLRKQTLNEFNRIQVPGMGKNLTYIDGAVGGGSKPSIDLSKVNKELLKDIDAAAQKSGAEISITTAKTGHRPGTRHEKYEAVDIAVINNKGFRDENMAIKNGIHDDIKRFVDELISMGYKKNVESGNDKSVLTFGFPGHHHHIHVSRKFGAGQSPSFDVEKVPQQDIDFLKTTTDKDRTLDQKINTNGSSDSFDDLLRKASEGKPVNVQDWVKQNFSFLNENKKIKKRSLKTQENINRIKNLLK
jgi:hypothetical protein